MSFTSVILAVDYAQAQPGQAINFTLTVAGTEDFITGTTCEMQMLFANNAFQGVNISKTLDENGQAFFKMIANGNINDILQYQVMLINGSISSMLSNVVNVELKTQSLSSVCAACIAETIDCRKNRKDCFNKPDSPLCPPGYPPRS